MKTRGIFFIAILFFTCFLSSITYSQDIIIKVNGEEITAKVIEVTPELVKYYKFNKTDGPLYSIYITDVNMIKYPDGSKDIFKTIAKDNRDIINEEIEDNKFIDERDGNEYKTVKIGDQWWMAENLRYKDQGSSCYEDDNNKCKECGNYYTFFVASKVCPKGWHLPSDKEWIKLEIAVGMSSVEAKKSGWRGTSPGQAPILLAGSGSGLELELCGRYDPSYFLWENYNDEGYYWTSNTINNQSAWARNFKLRKSIKRAHFHPEYSFPIRCIKDTE